MNQNAKKPLIQAAPTATKTFVSTGALFNKR